MPTLQSPKPSAVRREIRLGASDRPPVRVLLAGDGRASAFELRRLIAAAADLVDVGHPGGAQEALYQTQLLQPEVVVLDHTPSYDLVVFARELTSLSRPPAVVVRSAQPAAVMTIAAMVAGARGIVSPSDRAAVIRDAIRWVADGGHWLPGIPLVALSRVGFRLDRDDLPILLMLSRGLPAPDVAAGLGMSAAALDARRAAMLRAMLGEPALARSHRARGASQSTPAASEVNPPIAIAA